VINNVWKNEICDFCGEKKKRVAANQFHGGYCIKCLRICRKEDANCLRDIAEARANEKRGKNP
jgi:hypothetical protein